jgi:hypothetical protein
MQNHLTSTPTTSSIRGSAVQHNALVNARFGFNTLEMRTFLAMLGRIGRNDTCFSECIIPVRELAPEDSVHVPYAEVAIMIRKFARCAIDIERLGPDNRRQPGPDIVSLPLLHSISYTKAAGTILAQFNDAIHPYLLELQHNFTKAELQQLNKLKSGCSHRIYWLLKEHASFGQRYVSVKDLRNILGMTTQYAGRFDHFKIRVLERARQELALTDLPFTYELERYGKAVVGILFLFDKVKKQPLAPAPVVPPPAEWEAALLDVGVSSKSLADIRSQLAAGDYDEGYVWFVLQWVRTQVQAGKVRNEAGAVYQALSRAYLLAEYRKSAAGTATKAPAPAKAAALAKRRKKLEDQLADTRHSLQFAQSSTMNYSPEQRQQFVTEIQAFLTELEAQLAGLADSSS